MKILITGGCGFLGSNLAAAALRLNNEIVIFDNLHREGSAVNLEWLRRQGKLRFIDGDIRNANDISRLVREIMPNAVFHFAGQVAMTSSIADPRSDFEINVLGTVNLLEAVRRYSQDSAILYSSSNKVYGDLEQYTYRERETRFECIEKPSGFDEMTPLNFHSPYGCSKGAADQYMLDYARIFGVKTVVFRHSSMYGGRQFATYDQGWIGWFCQKAIEAKNGVLHEPFTISGTGKQVRDVLHANDVISLYFAALSKIEIVHGEAFNIGGGVENSLSLLELFDILEDSMHVKLNYRKIPVRESDQRVFIADYAKAQERLNWKPKIDKIEGIHKMLSWLRNEK